MIPVAPIQWAKNDFKDTVGIAFSPINFAMPYINIIREENPTWFDESHTKKVQELCLQAYDAERGIIDCIFAKG